MLHQVNPPPLFPNPATTDLCTLTLVFHFPEHPMTEITENVAFSDQLLSDQKEAF